jgi:hypothetical protein
MQVLSSPALPLAPAPQPPPDARRDGAEIQLAQALSSSTSPPAPAAGPREEPIRPPQPPAPTVPPPAPPPPQPAPELDLAPVQEILARCIAGDYLRAAFLAVGRAFGGLPDEDPSVEALLVAHHAGSQSGVLPLPQWCYDSDAAQHMAQSSPHSARLTFLAAQCQLAQDEGAPDPLPEQVGEALWNAFNDLPEVRRWLGAFRQATGVPGLWQQVCRPVPRDPAAEYRERRRIFEERYQGGLHHRSDKAAYIRRQDHFLSGQPVFRLLHERLKPDGPAPVSGEERARIEDWLQKRPEWITNQWHQSTERVSGRVKLHGTQRAELVRRAAEYLDCAKRAWRAAQALESTPATPRNVERLRGEIRDLLPPALARAQGQPWGPLFRRLTGRLPS